MAVPATVPGGDGRRAFVGRGSRVSNPPVRIDDRGIDLRKQVNVRRGIKSLEGYVRKEGV
jgi:hypothetical protein